MNKQAFEIYNASAGSGKTYTLVKEYLKIILIAQRDDAYKNILAITFTNKAVNEMKSRIVTTLQNFAQVGDSPMLLDIARETGLTPATIQEKSKRIIKNIIHNYSSFDISTIDKFIHRIIRSFALDLNLPMTFEVTLDTENLLSEAVDTVIAQAGEDETLTKILVDFATSKTDEDKSWDITNDFFEISKLLANENHRVEISAFQDKTIHDFIKIKQSLLKICEELQEQILTLAVDTLNDISDRGIEFNSFYSSYVPKHFQKIASGRFEVSTTHYKRLEDPSSRYSKSVPQYQKDLVDEIAPKVLENLIQINQLVGKLNLYREFLKHLTPLSALNTIYQEILNIQKERNILSISEFNNIIHKEIKNQPIPFIFEKLGDRYTHFFIDEFQDTSQMQWENLFPLFENALAGQNDYGEKGTLMIVGDPKQSIYRFRGGKAEQFIELSDNESPFVNPEKKTVNLERNFRSFSEVISFNNDFFAFLSNEFSEEKYQKIYLESTQQINSKQGGYVNISFIESHLLEQDNKEEIQELYLQQIEKSIEKAIANGFSYQEIALLVLTNQQGTLIARYLTEQNIPIVSSETLLLSNSDEVMFLVYLLHYMKDARNLEAKANFLYYLGRQIATQPIHDFLEAGVKIKDEAEFEYWLNAYGFPISFKEIRRKGMYEALEIIIETFLHKQHNVYIQSFLDMVLEQNLKLRNGIDDFLEYWTQEGYRKSIPSPKGNAVEILTIHKSKGLEFPVVIFPFADKDYSRAKRDEIWLENEFNEVDIPKFLVSQKEEMNNYSETSAQLFSSKQQELLLDHVNVLYVALTRAEEQLYIISQMTLTEKGTFKNTMASWFMRFLQDTTDFSTEKFVYEFGESTRKSTPEVAQDNIKIIHPVQSSLDFQSIKIATLDALMWDTKKRDSIEFGNVLHEILSRIESEKDVEKSIQMALDSGMITHENRQDITSSIYNIIHHPELKEFFNPSYRILNERTIVQKGLQLSKPDKVVLTSNKTAMLLDYKTGQKSDKYTIQINNYALALEEIGLQVTKKVLIYIGEEIEVVNI